MKSRVSALRSIGRVVVRAHHVRHAPASAGCATVTVRGKWWASARHCTTAPPTSTDPDFRVDNFSAGPSAVPESVLREAQANMLSHHGQGMNIMVRRRQRAPPQPTRLRLRLRAACCALIRAPTAQMRGEVPSATPVQPAPPRQWHATAVRSMVPRRACAPNCLTVWVGCLRVSHGVCGVAGWVPGLGAVARGACRR